METELKKNGENSQSRREQILKRLGELEAEGMANEGSISKEHITDERYQEYLKLQRDLDEINSDIR